MDEIMRTKLLRTSILGHQVMDKFIEGYDHDYSEFLQKTFAGLCDYLDTHLPNAESRETDTKAHGLSVQHRGKFVLFPVGQCFAAEDAEIDDILMFAIGKLERGASAG
jgi:hypothetical protein